MPRTVIHCRSAEDRQAPTHVEVSLPVSGDRSGLLINSASLVSVERVNHAHRQTSYSLRMDWAMAGAAAVVEDCDVAAVVDVLSFTTTLSVAVDRDVTVFPYRWRDDRAEAFAAEHHATLAVGRSAALPGQVSLSPHSVRRARSLERLVLPSPNGSTISFQLAQAGPKVIGVSLRNRQATAGRTSDATQAQLSSPVRRLPSRRGRRVGSAGGRHLAMRPVRWLRLSR